MTAPPEPSRTAQGALFCLFGTKKPKNPLFLLGFFRYTRGAGIPMGTAHDKKKVRMSV
jgi:hypothetical protein